MALSRRSVSYTWTRSRACGREVGHADSKQGTSTRSKPRGRKAVRGFQGQSRNYANVQNLPANRGLQGAKCINSASNPLLRMTLFSTR